MCPHIFIAALKRFDELWISLQKKNVLPVIKRRPAAILSFQSNSVGPVVSRLMETMKIRTPCQRF